jgi:hypothetical protein
MPGEEETPPENARDGRKRRRKRHPGTRNEKRNRACRFAIFFVLSSSLFLRPTDSCCVAPRDAVPAHIARGPVKRDSLIKDAQKDAPIARADV